MTGEGAGRARVTTALQLALFPDLMARFPSTRYQGSKAKLEVFDDYWMNYLTQDMARAIDSVMPYRNIEEYWAWRERIRRRG